MQRALVAASTQRPCNGAQTPGPRAPRNLKALPKGLGAAAALLAARPALAEPLSFGGGSIEVPSLPALPPVDLPAVDVSALGLDAIDPLYVAAGAALVAIPLGLSALLGGTSTPRAKAVPAATAAEALAADPGCLLVDIRSKAEAAETGSPSLKGVSKRAPATVPFTAVSKEVRGRSGGKRVACVWRLWRSLVPCCLWAGCCCCCGWQCACRMA